MNYLVASEYTGIGAWEIALKQLCKKNGDTFEVAYYAEWDEKASNAYSAIHNVSEDYNIWDTSLGYREEVINGETMYGIYTCMLGKTYIYYEDKKIKVGEEIDEDGEIQDIYETQRIYDKTLLFDSLWNCITHLIGIRIKHPKFKVDEDGQFILPKVNILFYSPPCQTYSIAGKRKGSTVDKGNMFWNTLVRINKLNPDFALMENVKGLPSGKTKKDFNNMLHDLRESGYYNYWNILNSKDYGIPQNRERVFVVSIRNDLYNHGKRFEWPISMKLELSLKDILEKEVEGKYYLSQKIIDGFLRQPDNYNGANAPKNGEETANCLTARMSKMSRTDNYVIDEIKQVGNIRDTDSFGGNPQTGRIYDPKGISPTLSTMKGGGQEPKVIIAASRGRDINNPSDRTTGNKNLQQRLEINKQGIDNTLTSVQKDNLVIQLKDGTKKGYAEARPGDCINLDQPNSNTNRNRVPGKVSSTLTTSCNVGYYNGFTIRRLTPLECFRLQGFSDEDYYKAVEAYDRTYGTSKDGLTRSDAQMYMRAGNSITVNVIKEILENLLYERKQEGQQLSFF